MMRRMCRLAGILVLVFSFSGITAQRAYETFGRNRVQYKDFDWKYLSSENFDVYFYGERRKLAQEALQFQHHSWDDMLAEMRANAGWTRYLLPPFAPLVRTILKRRGAYWKAPGRYADPWGAIRAKLGDPSWDRPYDRG